MQVKRVVGLTVGIISLVLLLGPGQLLSAEPKGVPDASDAAKTAAQELQALPPGAIQVDCRPGKPTFPPFTRLNVVPGTGSGFHVLADGRCFVDPGVVEAPSSAVFVVPIPSADPSAP